MLMGKERKKKEIVRLEKWDNYSKNYLWNCLGMTIQKSMQNFIYIYIWVPQNFSSLEFDC
jgi:hypothetical protein